MGKYFTLERCMYFNIKKMHEECSAKVEVGATVEQVIKQLIEDENPEGFGRIYISQYDLNTEEDGQEIDLRYNNQKCIPMSDISATRFDDVRNHVVESIRAVKIFDGNWKYFIVYDKAVYVSKKGSKFVKWLDERIKACDKDIAEYRKHAGTPDDVMQRAIGDKQIYSDVLKFFKLHCEE